MGKFYYCDNCGKMTWVLYNLIIDDKIIELCRTCYFEISIDKLEKIKGGEKNGKV